MNFVGQRTSNIALHQPAFQQNTYTLDPIEPNEDRFDASNAVDGLKSDLSGLGGQCSLTANNKTTATWWVNLTRVANIHYIIIYYRTDNVVWGKYFLLSVHVFDFCVRDPIVISPIVHPSVSSSKISCQ